MQKPNLKGLNNRPVQHQIIFVTYLCEFDGFTLGKMFEGLRG